MCTFCRLSGLALEGVASRSLLLLALDLLQSIEYRQVMKERRILFEYTHSF